MLNPFKSFLNNLQKNAEQLFGAKANTTDMNVNPEEEEEIAADSIYNIDELEPLDDPLALDGEYDGQTFENSESAFGSTNTTISELDGSEDGRIILVDVNSLKGSFTVADSYAGDARPSTSASSSTASRKTYSERNIGQTSVITRNNVENYDSIGLALDEITEEARSDGSDSGLGLEICSNLVAGKASTSTDSSASQSPPNNNLKRRSDQSDDAIDAVEIKKPKRNIQFTDVTVFYFPRIQGFTCVPSNGGSTLGMGSKHCDQRKFTLSEHTAEQKRIHRLQKMERLQANVVSVAVTNTNQPPAQTTAPTDERSRSSTEESESDEENDENVECDNSGSELDTDTNSFLQPLTQKQRRAVLKAAGIRDIASYEKNECRDIRASRELCGCRCRDFCDPDTCFCSRSGIKCQVDRPNFPCGCSENGCGNVFGRVEFNQHRVQTHFIHTIMKMEVDSKKPKKAEKQCSVITYDGRLRLSDGEEDTSAVDSANVAAFDQSHTPNPLVLYDPTNNMIYPPTSSPIQAAPVMHSTNIRHISAVASHNQYEDSSRNTAETSVELRRYVGSVPMAAYPPSVGLVNFTPIQPEIGESLQGPTAYRNEYPIEIPQPPTSNPPQPDSAQATNYPYTNSSYYRSSCVPSGYDSCGPVELDYMGISPMPTPPSTVLAYSNYGNKSCEVAGSSNVSQLNSVELVNASSLAHAHQHNGTYYGNQSANEIYATTGVSSMMAPRDVRSNKIGAHQYDARHTFSTTELNTLESTSQLVSPIERNTNI